MHAGRRRDSHRPDEGAERLRVHACLVSGAGDAVDEDVDGGVEQSQPVDVVRRPRRVDLLQAAVAAVTRLR